jgi:hypothetical protein
MKREIGMFSVLFILILISACSSSSSNESFAYQSMIRWNEEIYVATHEKVNKVDEKLGMIEHYTKDETDSDKEKSSNFFQKGTPIYQISSTPIEEAIAVEIESGVYVRANNINNLFSPQSTISAEDENYDERVGPNQL